MLFPFSDELRRALLVALPIACIALVAGFAWVAARANSWLQRTLDVALGLVLLLAFGVYTNNNWEKRRYFNPYEFFHYYVGSKYAAELGYTRLYAAALLVDRENDKGLATDVIRDLATTELVSAREALRDAPAIRAAFTPERWREFTQDVRFFQRELDPAMWQRLLIDKGYNATPAWTLVGGTLADAVPTGSRAGLRLLVGIDIFLLGSAFLCVALTFGWRAAALGLALFFTHYCSSHAHMRAAFMRTDWVAALLFAVCASKAGRPALAGALVAWAALSRIFPVLFVAGALVRLLDGVLRRRTVARGPARFLGSFALTAGVLVVASIVHGGMGAWSSFFDKIVQHDLTPASDTVGFRDLFLWTAGAAASEGHELRARFEEQALLWWTLQALFVALWAWVVRKRPEHEALALGFVLVWCLTAPAYYYYVVLLVPFLFLVEHMERPGRAFGLALLFATTLVARWVHPGREMTLDSSFALSCALGVLALALLLVAALESRRERSRALRAATETVS